MQEMVKRILEIDKEATKLTDEAQALKVATEQSIEEKKREIRENFLDRARKRIVAVEATERELARVQWEELRQQNALIAEHMEQSYKKMSETWVKEIMARVLD